MLSTHTWTAALAALLISVTATSCATDKAASSGAQTAPTQDMAGPVENQPSQAVVDEESSKAVHEDHHAEAQPMACTMTQCPMHTPGVDIRVENIEGGVALVFSAPEDESDGLLARVQWLAEQHNTYYDTSAEGPAQESQDGDMQRMPGSHAQVVEGDGSVTLNIHPTDPADLEDLRRHINHHAEMMQQGYCPLMATGHGQKKPVETDDDDDFWAQPVDFWPSLPAGF